MHAPSVIAHEDAVHHDGVKMKVEVEGAAESLDVVQSGRLGLREARGTPLLGCNGFDEDPPECGRNVGAERGGAPHFERQR
jgi:hypothetical protein